MRIKFISVILILSIALSISGCGKKSVAEESTIANQTDIDSTKIALSELTNNTYYIYHADGSIEPVYFGQATFSYGNTGGPDNSRVMWFMDDIDKVPTLLTGAGDRLIFYSKDVLSEKFIFERFKDLGYSVGIRGLRKTDTGRYTLSTKVNDKTTYPDSDADELLLLKNEVVIFEKMGDTSFAGDDDNNDGKIDRIVNVTEYGTIGISDQDRGKKFHFEVYEGTVKHEYDFMDNIWILGSLSKEQTSDYAFIADNLIEINIPKTFQTGYYNVNGCGVFRYVKGNSYEAIKHDKFNIVLPEGYYADDYNENTVKENVKTVTSKFTLAEQSDINIQISFSFTDETMDSSGIEAILILPDGRSLSFVPLDGMLKMSLQGAMPGNYVVQYLNIDPNTTTPNISVTAS